MDDFDDLDLAALEAIEANHYAAKQTQSVTLPPAAPHGLAATLACCPADQQHQTHANLQPTHQRKITDAHTAEHPLRVHLQDTETGVQTDKHGPAKPPLNHCMQPAAQRSPWVQQQQHFQHASSRQAPRQTSMQSFMALHANRRQPNVTATAFAAPPSSSAQQPARAACATGMLADDVDDCIDLTSQPEPHDPETAPQAGYICGAAQPYGPCQPAGAGAAVHDQAGKGREKETVEDIIDYHPKNPLMECSSNLLNPGIRVHKSNAKHWVYPATVNERAYQVDIIQTALLQNTLVCLPTGLGKTLIAAVVMYNFTRWFPEGKVVFVAPTKPLVNQQIQACYEFMGVSKRNIEELTGSCKRLDRQGLWEEEHKKIFFCTPQTFRNDVDRGICPHKKVVCLVVDECHRAKGNSDVVLAVKKLREEKCKFRVLGLSATPGSSNEAIQEVINNLMISAIQFRGETDPDIVPHVHQRCVEEKVVQPTREVQYCKQTLIHVLQDVMTSLARMKAYFGNLNAHACPRYGFLQAQERYKARADRNPLAGMVFRQAMVLTDCRDQLDSYGLDTALQYLDNKLNENAIRKLLAGNTMFAEFHKQLKQLVKRAATHPKMAALLEVVLHHFQPHGAPPQPNGAPSQPHGAPPQPHGAPPQPDPAQGVLSSPADADAGEGAAEQAAADQAGRVIIFTNRRDSVQSIVEMLRTREPVITARIFIGQASGKAAGVGMKQAEQKKVLTDFRAGAFNTLVATCIGEEGLDIPQVDLIVCYDSDASPIRNIQRMGRTGRHKPGRVVYIMSQGKEEESYRKGLQTSAGLQAKLRRGMFQLLERPARMLPRIFNPVQLNVACNAKTPVKEPEARKPKRGRGGKTSGESRASKGSGDSRAGRPASAAGKSAGTGGRGGQAKGSRGKQPPTATAASVIAGEHEPGVANERDALLQATSLAEAGSEGEDMLEQPPLAARLAEKQQQQQRMLADAAPSIGPPSGSGAVAALGHPPPISGASEQHASAALRPAPNLAGRPSWVRPQQQPTAVPPSAAEQASDAEPLTQPYPPLHTAICPPPDLAANLEGGASGYDHAVRPGEAGTPAGIEGGTEAGTAAGTASGTEAATAAGIEGGTEAGTESGAAVQAGSTAEQAHHTQVSAQMTHKPFVFDIEDSCDGNQAQPAFIIDIDDFPEPAAQVTCDLPPDAAAASSAQAGSGTLLRTSSPSARATAQLPSAAPLQTRRQSASVMAGKPKLGQQEELHRLSGQRSPGMKPAPVGLIPTDAMATVPIDPMGSVPVDAMGPVPSDARGTVPIDLVGPVPIDTMGAVGSDAMGPVPTDAVGPLPSDAMGPWASDAMGPEPSDAMTVPDTPPYSYASHIGSPSGPTWLSPMLTKQQAGQGKQYSPSMLGRPAGMPHMDSSVTHAATIAATQIQPSSHMGPYPAQVQQPLVSQLPEGHNLRAAAACVGDVPSQAELRPGFPPRGQGQAASLRPGSLPTTVPSAVDQGRSPGHAIAAAATGVFAAWNRQEAIESSAVSLGAVRPQPDAHQLQGRQQSQQQQSQQQQQQSQQQSQQQQQPSSTDTLAAQGCANLADSPRQPRWASPLRRHQMENSAGGTHLLTEAELRQAHPDASESAKPSRRGCRGEHAPQEAEAASSLHISPKAPVLPAVSKAAADKAASSAVAAAAASPPVTAAAATATAPEGKQLVTQQGADTADYAPSCTADDWDWQQSQSQANLGFQDAFDATQGFGVTPDLTPAATWAALKPAARPATVSSLPVKAAGQAKAQHVPFSTRRMALPGTCTKPETKQCTAVAVQQPNCEFLNVRRPLPKQQGPQSPQHTAVAEASAQSHGADARAKRQSSWSPQTASVPRSRKVARPSAYAQALAVCDSHPKRDATAAAQVAGLNSSHMCATATASGKATMTSKSTAAAARSRSSSPAEATVAAASPAAAIFGPHIAEPVCSQSHAKKKLCLRLAPRQAEPTAAASSAAVVAAGLHPAGRSALLHQQPQAQRGIDGAAAGTAEDRLAESSSARQQSRGGRGEADEKGEGKRDGQVKGPGNDEVICREAKDGATTSAVIPPTDNELATASPEAATPTGKVRMGGCPSPATAARMMPPPSTGRFLRPPPAVLASHAALHTSSTPRPQQRKKRRRAAQQGHVLLTQESPGSGSPDRASLPDTEAAAQHRRSEEASPLHARLKRLKRTQKRDAVHSRRHPAESAQHKGGRISSNRHCESTKRKADHGKVHRRRVAAFVDIEAEASDDEAEEESSDGPEGEEEEATEADAMFVNDASPASTRSQPERGHADMMAVYNQHLLQSGTPVLKFKKPRWQHTPMADTPRSNASSTYDLEDSFLAQEEEESDMQSEDEVSQHDEACSICHRADDVDMLLCDGCPKVFHLSCLGLSKVPPDDWLCAVCKDAA